MAPIAQQIAQMVNILPEADQALALELVKKWFGDIPPGSLERPAVPQESAQREERRLVVEGNEVPADAIYKVFHMGARASAGFYACDVVSDILSNGQSARLYVNLMKKRRLFRASTPM